MKVVLVKDRDIMPTHNLEAIFRPSCVVLIGASAQRGTVGALAALNLQEDGFRGQIMFVNPHLESLNGLIVYPDVQSLPESPDLAVIATPPNSVPTLITELGARGSKAAIIITAGFGELGQRGKALQQATLEAAWPYGLRLVGPNCVGVIAPRSGLNARFSHLSPPEGDLAFVSQSGAMVTAVLEYDQRRIDAALSIGEHLHGHTIGHSVWNDCRHAND